MSAPPGSRGAPRGKSPFRRRIALRIYLVGLAQFAVVAAGLFVLLQAARPHDGGPIEAESRLVERLIVSLSERPASFDGELQKALEDARAKVAVSRSDGSVIASTIPGSGGVCQPSPECFSREVRLASGETVTVVYRAPNHPPSPGGLPLVLMVLVVVGVSSLFLARTLTRPLARLSSAARQLGSGDLKARVGLRTRDELGDVSSAFDDMAERVTELLRAERELLANVSHELRTPLSRIRVALDLAAEGDAEMQKELLTDISTDLAELEELISNVLAAARLEFEHGSTGLPPLRLEQIEPGELLGRSRTNFKKAHPDRPLETEIAADLPAVSADAVLLRRVVDNLLENAHKYSDAARSPIILRARDEGALVIEVEDRGVGIAPVDVARVFRPFFRTDESRSRKTGGLGLGLSLCKRIVEAHGGEISLESEVGRGTLVRVTIPRPPQSSRERLRSEADKPG